VKESARVLSKVHYITLEALDTVAQLSASKAASQEMLQRFMGPRLNAYGASNATLRQWAAEAGLECVLASECVASGCSGCYNLSSTSFPHEPCYDLGSKVFHACTDLQEVPENCRPRYATSVVKRYLPVMRGLFGEGDQDVKMIEVKLLGNSSVSLPLDTPKANSKGGKTKKKKGRRKK
jgi:hypothetical protein